MKRLLVLLVCVVGCGQSQVSDNPKLDAQVARETALDKPFDVRDAMTDERGRYAFLGRERIYFDADGNPSVIVLESGEEHPAPAGMKLTYGMTFPAGDFDIPPMSELPADDEGRRYFVMGDERIYFDKAGNQTLVVTATGEQYPQERATP